MILTADKEDLSSWMILEKYRSGEFTPQKTKRLLVQSGFALSPQDAISQMKEIKPNETHRR